MPNASCNPRLFGFILTLFVARVLAWCSWTSVRAVSACCSSEDIEYDRSGDPTRFPQSHGIWSDIGPVLGPFWTRFDTALIPGATRGPQQWVLNGLEAYSESGGGPRSSSAAVTRGRHTTTLCQGGDRPTTGHDPLRSDQDGAVSAIPSLVAGLPSWPLPNTRRRHRGEDHRCLRRADRELELEFPETAEAYQGTAETAATARLGA